MTFLSDTAAPAHPAILDALARANEGQAASYGGDAVTARMETTLKELFECDLAAWPCVSGTAANAVAISLLCGPMGAVACHEEAHIERDERGATEFFSGGGKLRLLPGAHAKLDLAALSDAVEAIQRDFVHETPLEALSLTNLTECGAAYTAAEIAQRADVARRAGLRVHLDGARFANALASTGASPGDMTWRAGVDIATFGATKNGALGCDVVLVFNPTSEKRAELHARAKRAGHMPPKMRFLSAQMEAYLCDDLWLILARKANAAAKKLSLGLNALPGTELAHPTEGNEVFVRLPSAGAAALEAAGIGSYPWPGGSRRFVCAWNTTDAEVDAALAAVRAALVEAPEP